MPTLLTQSEKETLTGYAQKNGRRWKSALLTAWESGNYRTAPAGTASALQAIRNERGPSWLREVTIR